MLEPPRHVKAIHEQSGGGVGMGWGGPSLSLN
jgi:hypothetical protein